MSTSSGNDVFSSSAIPAIRQSLPTLTPLRAVLAGGLGSLMEYYDFSVYGFLAVTLAPLFFPNQNASVALLSTLAVYGVGFVARPIGGWFFGQLGDRHGRRRTLVITVVLMGLSSTLMGLLPTYSAVGVVAPVLVIVSRLAQGFSAGGEVSGAATYVAEAAPRNRRGLSCSVVPAVCTLAVAIAAAIVGLTSILVTPEQMSAWGWRIPFLVALPLMLLCLAARLRLGETPEFAAMVQRKEVTRSPLLTTLKTHRGALLQFFLVCTGMSGVSYVGSVYFNTYIVSTLGFDKRVVFWTSAIVIGLASLTFPFIGMLTDRVGRKPVLLAGFILFAVVAWPVFAAMSATSSIIVIGLIYFAYIVLQGVVLVPVYAALTERFPRKVRLTGVSLAFNLGTIAGGGTAPYVAALLVQTTGSSKAPAIWVGAAAVLGLAAAITLRETRNQPLPV